MIKELKLGFKLLRYSSQLKLSIVLCVLFLALGFTEFLITPQRGSLVGFIFLVNGIWPVQLLFSVNTSNQVQSSSSKKKLQTRIPAAMFTLFELVLYSILVILILSWMNYIGIDVKLMKANLLALGFFAFFLGAYIGVVFKYFFFSTVVFVSIYITFFGAFYYFFLHGETQITFSMPVTILLGYALVLAGGIMQYLLFQLLYKKKLSKYAQGSEMRKYM